MLSLFPSLLGFSYAGIALLRIAVALAFVYAAYYFARERAEISHTKVLLLGHIPEWFVWIGSGIAFVVAVLFGIGLYTQAVAIAGMIMTLKCMIGWRRYRAIIPFSLGTSALLFVICLFLLLSGAGPFAFDLPL